MSEVVSAVASKMTRSVLGRLSQAGCVCVCVRAFVCVFCTTITLLHNNTYCVCVQRMAGLGQWRRDSAIEGQTIAGEEDDNEPGNEVCFSLCVAMCVSLSHSHTSHSTNIPDERRAVSSISVSPLGDLCACVDHFGRVLLLHSHSMTIRRMWKGAAHTLCTVIHTYT